MKDKETPDDEPLIKAGTGSTCWLNGKRMCGPDCTAYNVHNEGETELQCSWLVIGGQLGQGVVEIANLLRRQNSPPMPPPPTRTPG